MLIRQLHFYGLLWKKNYFVAKAILFVYCSSVDAFKHSSRNNLPKDFCFVFDMLLLCYKGGGRGDPYINLVILLIYGPKAT